jgi:hypothetical protein
MGIMLENIGCRFHMKVCFFAVGDNRCFSTDSRLLGAIPENLIVGRVDYVLFSISMNKKLRKDRFFRKL